VRKHRLRFEATKLAFQDPSAIRDYGDREYDEDRWELIARVSQGILERAKLTGSTWNR
jgi:hypothetical protein